MPSENKTSQRISTSCGDFKKNYANIANANLTNLNERSYSLGVGLTTTGNLLTAGNSNTAIGSVALTNYNGMFNNNWLTSKEGDIVIDSNTMESKIYLSEFGGWINCEIENIKNEINKEGRKIKSFVVLFHMSVYQMLKRRKERSVITEKYKKNNLILGGLNNSMYMNYDGSITLGTLYFPNDNTYIGHTLLGQYENPITFGNSRFTTIDVNNNNLTIH